MAGGRVGGRTGKTFLDKSRFFGKRQKRETGASLSTCNWQPYKNPTEATEGVALYFFLSFFRSLQF